MSDAESSGDWSGPQPARRTAPADETAGQGSLGLLLDAARAGKIDLARVRLADLIEAALRSLAALPRLEDRAEGLGIAAELVALKARLLLPQSEDDPAADEAVRLRTRLERLAVMQAAGRALMERPRLGRDIFARGEPELTDDARRAGPARLSLLGLVRAWAALQRREDAAAPLRIDPPVVMSLREALATLDAALAARDGWTPLEGLVPRRDASVPAPSVRAASLCGALELVRQGRIELRQRRPTSPLEVRRVEPGPSGP